jgi:hypothetical protein
MVSLVSSLVYERRLTRPYGAMACPSDSPSYTHRAVVNDRQPRTPTQPTPSPGAPHTIRYGGWRITLRVESVEWIGEDTPIPKPESERTLSIQLRGIYRVLNLRPRPRRGTNGSLPREEKRSPICVLS